MYICSRGESGHSGACGRLAADGVRLRLLSDPVRRRHARDHHQRGAQPLYQGGRGLILVTVVWRVGDTSIVVDRTVLRRVYYDDE